MFLTQFCLGIQTIKTVKTTLKFCFPVQNCQLDFSYTLSYIRSEIKGLYCYIGCIYIYSILEICDLNFYIVQYSHWIRILTNLVINYQILRVRRRIFLGFSQCRPYCNGDLR